MIKAILFQVTILMVAGTLFVMGQTAHLPAWISHLTVPINTALSGCLGGVIYCIRGIYLNACVHNKWDDNWSTWYYLRPLVSMLCGIVAFIFLKAGLLVLESQANDGSSFYGFYAFGFIAGYNVDRFLGKLEDVAESTWGISKSRIGKQSTEKRQ